MATPEEIKIRIIAADEASNVFDKTRKSSDRFKDSINKLKVALLGISVAGGVFLKSVIDTGAQVQALRVRLRFLTGSVQSGARAFQLMSQYASTVPFALEEIQQGSAQLLTVANNVDELNGLLKITGDLAAVSGLSFAETASQIQRAFSSGIASADLFRERGVAAFLGFQSGVSYSAEQTRNLIISAFRDGTTSAAGATNELADTFIGQVSMMQDAWFNLKLSLADSGLTSEATKQIKELTEILKDPAVIEGAITITGALLDLFRFVTENAKVLLTVGSVWLGAKAGASFGDLLGKKGKAIGGAVGGITALLIALGMMDDALDETKEALEENYQVLDVKYPDALDKSAEATKNMAMQYHKLGEDVKYTAMTMDDVGIGALDSLEDGLVSLINGTQSASQAFKNMARSIINDLIRMSIQQRVTAPLFNAMFGSVAPTIATAPGFTTIGPGATPTNAPGSVVSFDGGGFTGGGGRSGGVDGKGGFPAILHPNETVVDHTRGQGGAAPVNVTLNISTGVAQTVRAEIANLLPQITNAAKAAVIDARKRGGSFAGAFGA